RYVMMKELTLLSRTIVSFFATGRSQLYYYISKNEKSTNGGGKLDFIKIKDKIKKLFQRMINTADKLWDSEEKNLTEHLLARIKTIDFHRNDWTSIIYREMVIQSKLYLEELLERAKKKYIEVVIQQFCANYEKLANDKELSQIDSDIFSVELSRTFKESSQEAMLVLEYHKENGLLTRIEKIVADVKDDSENELQQLKEINSESEEETELHDYVYNQK